MRRIVLFVLMCAVLVIAFIAGVRFGVKDVILHQAVYSDGDGFICEYGGQMYEYD